MKYMEYEEYIIKNHDFKAKNNYKFYIYFYIC